MTACLKCFSVGIGVLILLGATLGISITSIVLGAINLNSNCTGVAQIPAYLITTGVLGLVTVLLRASDSDSESENDCEDDGEKKKDSKFLQLIHLGHFGVLIWGSVILFGADRPDCDRVLFDYAFWSTITVYIILALFLLFCCCAMSAVCCQSCVNNCCGDGDGHLKYECKCCGVVLCADNVTKAEKQTTTTSEVVIEMPSIGMPRVGKLDRGTEC